jgi:hypothetical protein
MGSSRKFFPAIVVLLLLVVATGKHHGGIFRTLGRHTHSGFSVYRLTMHKYLGFPVCVDIF